MFPAFDDQLCWIVAGGDARQWPAVRNRVPLRDIHAALHCWYSSRGIAVCTVGASAAADKEFSALIDRKLDALQG